MNHRRSARIADRTRPACWPSVASCLSASLVFCLTKAGVEVGALVTEVNTELVRNERRRLRIGKLSVRLQPTLFSTDALDPCLDVFEDFCVVTESVRQGVAVDVSVVPELGDAEA
jgi:organic hydroperoxide reductase OsmC/OhrA